MQIILNSTNKLKWSPAVGTMIFQLYEPTVPRVRVQRSKAVTAIWNQLRHVQLIITHFAHSGRHENGGKNLEDLYLDMWALPYHCTIVCSYEKNAPLWVPYHTILYIQ